MVSGPRPSLWFSIFQPEQSMDIPKRVSFDHLALLNKPKKATRPRTRRSAVRWRNPDFAHNLNVIATGGCEWNERTKQVQHVPRARAPASIH